MKKSSLFVKIAALFLTASLGLGTLLGVTNMGDDGFSGFIKPFLICLGIGVFLVILLLYTALKSSYDNKHKYGELNRIYAEKGPCEEYIQEYIRTHEKMTVYDRIIVADMYASVERYDKAEETISSLSLSFFTTDDTNKALFCLVKMNIFLFSGRTQQAIDIFGKEKKFLDIYFQSLVGKQSAGAYYDTAACLSAAMGYEGTAGEFLSKEKEWAEKNDSTGLLPRLTETAVTGLSGHRREALEMARTLRSDILSCEKFAADWQREHYLTLLDRILRLIND